MPRPTPSPGFQMWASPRGERRSRETLPRTATKKLAFAVAAFALLGAGREERLKSSVIRAIEKEYYRQVDSSRLGRMSFPEILESLDVDSSLLSHPSKDLDYIRGFRKKMVLKIAKTIPPGIGLIALDHISEATVKELAKACRRLKKEGAGGFILDLRGNSGGNLKAALKIAGRMSPKDKVLVTLTTRNGRQVHRLGTDRPGKDAWVILTDSRTASGAEIIVLAWRKGGPVSIVGTPTQGKSSVQQLFAVESKWLSLTVGHWEMDGFDSGPIEPDFKIDDPDEQMAKAIQLLKN